jgi:hypothetical protein
LSPLARALAQPTQSTKAQEKAPSQTSKPQSLEHLAQLEVIPSDSPDFLTILHADFPLLVYADEFTALLPYLVILRNTTSSRIRAVHMRWNANRYVNNLPRTGSFFVNSASQQLRYRRQTGMTPVLSANDVALASPFFLISKKQYAKLAAKRSRLVRYLTASVEGRERTWNSIGAVPQQTIVPAQICGIVTKEHKAITDGISKIAERYRVIRNAEHDEAYSVRRLRKSTTTKQELLEVLRKHKLRPLDNLTGNQRLYWSTRKAYASKLLRHAKMYSFKSTKRLITKVNATQKPRVRTA